MGCVLGVVVVDIIISKRRQAKAHGGLVRPQLVRLRQLLCPTCCEPARESDLGWMSIETTVLTEILNDDESPVGNYAITDTKLTPTHDIQTITAASSW